MLTNYLFYSFFTVFTSCLIALNSNYERGGKEASSGTKSATREGLVSAAAKAIVALLASSNKASKKGLSSSAIKGNLASGGGRGGGGSGGGYLSRNGKGLLNKGLTKGSTATEAIVLKLMLLKASSSY